MTDISLNMTSVQKTKLEWTADFSPKVTLVQMTSIRLKADIRPNMTFIQDICPNDHY